MDFLSTLLILGGLVCFVACLILIVINVIRKRSVKKYALGLAVCGVLLVFGAIISPSPDKPEDATEKATTEQATEATTEKPVEATTEQKVEKVDVKTMLSLIETSIGKNFSDSGIDYTIDADDDGNVTLNVSNEGIAMATTLAANGNEENLKAYNTMKESLKTMSSKGYELMSTMGYEKCTFVVNLLNDENKENVLLSLVNGAVLYDCLSK